MVSNKQKKTIATNIGSKPTKRQKQINLVNYSTDDQSSNLSRFRMTEKRERILLSEVK